jgi:hypothetical protein
MWTCRTATALRAVASGIPKGISFLMFQLNLKIFFKKNIADIRKEPCSGDSADSYLATGTY